MALQRKDIINKVFTNAGGGYDMDEVDSFLDMLADTLDLKDDALAVERRRSYGLTSEIQRLEGILNHQKETNQTAGEELLAQAHRQARLIVEEAAEQAKVIVFKAQQDAESILTEAQAQAAAAIKDSQYQCKVMVNDAAEQAKLIMDKANDEAQAIVDDANAQSRLIVAKCIDEAGAILEQPDFDEPDEQEFSEPEDAYLASEDDCADMPDDEDGAYPSTQWLNDPESRYDD